jgi:hypothetical protein
MANNEVKLIITTDSTGAVTGIKDLEGKVKSLRDDTEDSTSSMSKSITNVGDAWALVQKAIMSYGAYKIVDASMEYLARIETATLGIAAAFMTGGTYVDATTGKVLEGEKALRAAQIDSKKLIEELQYANLQTIATLDQLIVAYQQTLPVALAKGFNVQQVKDFTVAMVQAAGAIGLPMDQLAEETRSLINSQVAAMSKYGADDVSIAKWAAGEKAKALSTYQTSAQSTDASVRASAQSTYDSCRFPQKTHTSFLVQPCRSRFLSLPEAIFRKEILQPLR